MTVLRLDALDWSGVLAGPHHPSPSSWADQVLYFLLVDRFSDGREDGVADLDGVPAAGPTPLISAADHGNAVTTDADAARWRDAGATWVGGTLTGVRSKLGYLQRLGITTLWISPVLRQRVGTPDYHGYGIQNFLEVDPHYGTADDLRDLVAAAHAAGIYVILDVVLNHTGDVFGYAPGDTPRSWTGAAFPVAGWRDGTGIPQLPTDQPLDPARPDAGVWPAELQTEATFTRKGRIRDWDRDPEYREGDFLGYKDVHHGSGPIDAYVPSPALLDLISAYAYWIAYADLDGLRIDTVKHMDPGASRLLVSAIKEFAASLGKDSFFLVGEITGSRGFAVELMQTTGLDAALGLADVQGRLESSVKGWSDPAEYFDLFRNSALVGQGSHTWFGPHVVTSYDDHDQVRKGDDKARFAADADGRALAVAVLAQNVATLGIPCVYYGSEQALDGAGGNDRYVREAMLGGAFGPFRSAGRHAFDESSPVYRELAAILAVRRSELALRRGRQYLRPISGDGVSFGLPRRIGAGRMTSLVAWSRILYRREVLCVINTDTAAARSAWVTVDAGLHGVGAELGYAYSSEPAIIGERASVEDRNGRAVRVTVPAAGVAILVPAA